MVDEVSIQAHFPKAFNLIETLRNYNCSNYAKCLSVAAMVNEKSLHCDKCRMVHDTGAALSVESATLYEETLNCCKLLVAMFILPETPPERTPIPKILDWTVVKHEQTGRYRAYRRLNGDVKSLYIGMTLENAERKIQAFLDTVKSP